MTETMCSDCDGALALVHDDADAPGAPGADLDLMCVLCGAALSLGGLLLGEAEAWADAWAELSGAGRAQDRGAA